MKHGEIISQTAPAKACCTGWQCTGALFHTWKWLLLILQCHSVIKNHGVLMCTWRCHGDAVSFCIRISDSVWHDSMDWTGLLASDKLAGTPHFYCMHRRRNQEKYSNLKMTCSCPIMSPWRSWRQSNLVLHKVPFSARKLLHHAIAQLLVTFKDQREHSENNHVRPLSDLP